MPHPIKLTRKELTQILAALPPEALPKALRVALTQYRTNLEAI
jgi:hypothetical protein